jgi:hypothetical protein
LAAKLFFMYHLGFWLRSLTLVLILCACSGGAVTPPCTGENCPQPCEDIGDAVVSYNPANSFTATSSLKNCYQPSASQTASIKITPNKANVSAPRIVVVFDVIRWDAANNFPSVVTQVLNINSLTINPDIFREPITTSLLISGLEADFSFQLKSNAPTGDYAFVISFFRLHNGQTPNQVTRDPNSLAGRVLFRFSVER